jgi:putative ATP-dependent endonuclease of OLD family
VPLRDIRLVSLLDGKTVVTGLPRPFEPELPWNASLDGLMRNIGRGIFSKSANTGKVIFHRWFNAALADRLKETYRDDPNRPALVAMIDDLRYKCRILPSEDDESDLLFHGRRVRGEIFFARRWIMVEGVCEYLLIRAIADALQWSLDAHGVTVIDFQQSGSAGIYPALAEVFAIPWDMITDGDDASEKFRGQILDRGFREPDLAPHFTTLPSPCTLEEQLIQDGHEPILREIMHEIAGGDARTCPPDQFLTRLKKRKTEYMSKLAPRIVASPDLARRMPAPFVNLINRLKGSGP